MGVDRQNPGGDAGVQAHRHSGHGTFTLGRSPDQAGFSLIELLIVAVVLGILASIVVTAAEDLTVRSSATACEAQYKTVETALESYKGQLGNYPAPNNFSALTVQTTSRLVQGTVGPWIKEVPPTASGSGVVDWFGFNSSGQVIVNNQSTTSVGSTAACK
jgi:prepilin-type N-terminal cleavage/methylation domain-containing protein